MQIRYIHVRTWSCVPDYLSLCGGPCTSYSGLAFKSPASVHTLIQLPLKTADFLSSYNLPQQWAGPGTRTCNELGQKKKIVPNLALSLIPGPLWSYSLAAKP